MGYDFYASFLQFLSKGTDCWCCLGLDACLCFHNVVSHTWAFILKLGSSQSDWSCQVPLAGLLGTRLLAQLEGWMMQNPLFLVMQSGELAGASGQLFMETKSTLIKYLKKTCRKQLIAAWSLISFTGHPQVWHQCWAGLDCTLQTQLGCSKAAGWKLGCVSWKAYSFHDIPKQQPPLSKASSQLWKAHANKPRQGHRG